MVTKRKLVLLFGLLGLAGGLGTSIFLWLFGGPQFMPAALPWALTLFPLLAAAWSCCFKVSSFGAVHGALVALLTLASFWALFLGLGPSSVWIYVAWLYFSFLCYGWLIVLLGFLIGRHLRNTRSAV